MLSLFPQILFLSPFSALLLRLALAVVFAYSAWHHLSVPAWLPRLFAILEIVLAVTLFAGVWTQAAALAAGLVALLWLTLGELRVVSKGTAGLAIVICLSLLVTGAGALAFDLPL